MYKVGSTTLMLCCACNCIEHSGLKSRKKCNLLKAIHCCLPQGLKSKFFKVFSNGIADNPEALCISFTILLTL